MTTPPPQLVRFLFLRADPAWRRLDPEARAGHLREFGDAVLGFRARLVLRTYSLVGMRGDADLLLWQMAGELDAFQRFQTAIFSTGLGAWLTTAHSYLGMLRRSSYQLPDDAERERSVVRPQDAPYLVVYPFVKTRAWYALPKADRQAMMEEHVRIGRQYPGVRINTMYSFGLDDQEFVVAFEMADPAQFVSLVMELRESAASAYTFRDTPSFTCIQMSIREALDTLGGDGTAEGTPSGGGGFVAVARRDELPEGTAQRVYCGSEAIALFNVGGRIHAVTDRCTHGRASLSEGTVDPATCELTCPWHGGRFDLVTGLPKAGPPQAPLGVFEVMVDGDRILVR
jgi:chlorite dismutase